MKKTYKVWIGLLFSSIISLNSHSSIIAIIDSGTDMEHEVIAPKAWFNAGEIADNGRDEDRNGYQDDVYGWNFAESNNKVIDYSYLGLLNDDIKKFFDTQAKAIQGQATQEDIDWMRNILKDPEFLKRIQVYGNFMHGTHVAGISARMSDDAKIIAAKLIPTEVKLPGQKISPELANTGIIDTLVKKAIDGLAKAQMTMMEEIGYYVGGHKARVANGSFGTGYPQARGIVGGIYKAVTKKDLSEELTDSYAKYFLNSLIKEGRRMPEASPSTLFVFAAGNDGLDNDKFPTSPTNIQADNVISVAATIKYNSLAPFSNYGKTMVDVAAPGVAITSAAPGNKYISVSGTSQAAPYVAGLAGKIIDTNPELSSLEVKKIIMGTVDVKEFLSGKVSTGGVVNFDRAVVAAEYTLRHSVKESIGMSIQEVRDVASSASESSALSQLESGFILPLPSQFK